MLLFEYLSAVLSQNLSEPDIRLLVPGFFSWSCTRVVPGGLSVIGYLTLGTNDLARAGEFYDALFDCLGAKRVMTDERMLGWGRSAKETMFSVITPYDGMKATIGNGVMIALDVGQPDQVDAMYRKALELGGSDEGHPHDRGSDMGFYGGYFRDLDGNKLVVYCLGYSPDGS